MKRTKSPLSLIMIDVDDFKKVNDTLGHLKGDEVLQRLASIFRESMRAIDTVARWGGEEFAVILPGTSTEGATAFAERLRRTIDASDFGCSNVTISVGVISASEGMDIDQLVSLVDKALYQAKRNKNVVVSGTPSAPNMYPPPPVNYGNQSTTAGHDTYKL